MSASRFFATLYWAPASRIFKRRSVDCATERPLLRVTTTTLVSVKTFFSSSTRSAFCERSMPTPYFVRSLGFERGSTKLERGAPKHSVRGELVSLALHATHDGGPRRCLRMIPVPV